MQLWKEESCSFTGLLRGAMQCLQYAHKYVGKHGRVYFRSSRNGWKMVRILASDLPLSHDIWNNLTSFAGANIRQERFSLPRQPRGRESSSCTVFFLSAENLRNPLPIMKHVLVQGNVNGVGLFWVSCSLPCHLQKYKKPAAGTPEYPPASPTQDGPPTFQRVFSASFLPRGPGFIDRERLA